jgi:CheY-like chemotaxis protein
MVKKRLDKGEKPYDLIFMDIHMPVMDGIQASILINELNTGTPIIALTANVMIQDKEMYLRSGMKDSVGKPFRAQELWHCLLKHLTPIEWKAESEVEKSKYDEELQNTLIKNFVKDNKDAYAKIIHAIETRDFKLANRLAHTLKSNAGMLGKTVLQKIAEEMEFLIDDEKSQVTAEHLERLRTELQAVLDELEPLVKKTILPQTPVETLNAKTARELLEEIRPFLESGSSECLKYVNVLRGIPESSGSEVHGLLDELIQQMEDLECTQAVQTLDELLKVF